MPIVSVLTPAQRSRRDFLMQAGQSVTSQVLPSGWTLEWLVQEDGQQPSLQTDVAQFGCAEYESNNEQLGAGETRNLALRRVQGDLVHVIDSDDLLLPGALSAAINAFADNSEIHWVAAQADDLLLSGERVPFAAAIAVGPISPGVVNDYISAGHDPYLPVHPAGLTIRTDTVRALGGWGAYPCAEDVWLLAALSELTPGYLLPEVTWLYRKHPQQITAANRWKDLGPQIATQRRDALRKFLTARRLR